MTVTPPLLLFGIVFTVRYPHCKSWWLAHGVTQTFILDGAETIIILKIIAQVHSWLQ